MPVWAGPVWAGPVWAGPGKLAKSARAARTVSAAAGLATATAWTPNSAGPDSGQATVLSTQDANPGPWTDTTDLRSTELYLLGLRDDYQNDGRVISQILSSPNRALGDPATAQLAACFKQLNSSVGAFGAYTLVASTSAVNSTSTNDQTYTSTNDKLLSLEKARDALAGLIKGELADAAFNNRPVLLAGLQTLACNVLIAGARQLAASTS